MPKFFIKTYGCQMNERDSEQVAHSLIARGYERVAHESEADVVLLNTCSVRDMADQKALGKMGMLGRMWCSGFSVAWPRPAANPCSKICRTWISLPARRNSIA